MTNTNLSKKKELNKDLLKEEIDRPRERVEREEEGMEVPAILGSTCHIRRPG